MTTILKMNQGVRAAIKDFLRHLLETGAVHAVFTLRKQDSPNVVSYSLIADPEKLDEATPFYPVMPGNAGGLLSRITLNESFKDPVAAVLRPCELRAFVELVKRQQGNPANIVTISSICAGVSPLKASAQWESDQQVDEYWSAISNGELPPNIRDSCRICEHPVPMGADIVVPVAGEEEIDSKCSFLLNSEKGAKLAEGMPGEIGETEQEVKEVEQIRSFREKQRSELATELEKTVAGLERVIETFASCTSCHGCRAVCPICYCQLCEFDSSRSELKAQVVETELRKRGGIRIPPGTLAFHIGRLAHMAISCVGCGMCSDVCPAEIPVSSVFWKVGKAVQELFDYTPGRSVEEAIPITVFEEDELCEVED